MDTLTEKLIMDAINKLKQNTTIILIAHRLTTIIKKCDKIFLLDKGKLSQITVINNCLSLMIYSENTL